MSEPGPGDLEETINVVLCSRLSDVDKGKINRLLRLVSKSSLTMDAFELRLAREAAGLAVGQAAKLLRLKVSELSWLEVGDWNARGFKPDPEMAEDFDRIYCLGSATASAKAGG